MDKVKSFITKYRFYIIFIPIISIILLILFLPEPSSKDGVIVDPGILSVPMNFFDDIAFFMKKIFHFIISILIFILLGAILWIGPLLKKPSEQEPTFLDNLVNPFANFGEWAVAGIAALSVADSKNENVKGAAEMVIWFWLTRLALLAFCLFILASPVWVPIVYYKNMVYGEFGKKGMYAIQEARTFWNENPEQRKSFAHIAKQKNSPIIDSNTGHDEEGFSLSDLTGFKVDLTIQNLYAPLVYSEVICEAQSNRFDLKFLEPIITWEENAIFTSGDVTIELNFPEENFLKFKSDTKIEKNIEYDINCELTSTYHKDKVLPESKHVKLLLYNQNDEIEIINNYKKPITQVDVKCITRDNRTNNSIVETQEFVFENNMVLPAGRSKTLKTKRTRQDNGKITGIIFSKAQECTVVDFN